MKNTYIPFQMKVKKIYTESPDRTLKTFDLSYINKEDKFDFLPGQFVV